MQSEIQFVSQTVSQTIRQSDSQTISQTFSRSDRQTVRQSDRESVRQTVSQTELRRSHILIFTPFHLAHSVIPSADSITIIFFKLLKIERFIFKFLNLSVTGKQNLFSIVNNLFKFLKYPWMPKIKIRNLSLNRLLIVEFGKKMVYLGTYYSEHQGLMG